MLIRVKPTTAALKKGNLFEFLWPLNPYIIMRNGNSYSMFEPHFGGGRFPFWTQVISIVADPKEPLIFEIWNKDMLTKDDLLGTASFKLEQLFPTNQFDKNIDLFLKGKHTGTLQVSITCGNAIPTVSCTTSYRLIPTQLVPGEASPGISRNTSFVSHNGMRNMKSMPNLMACQR